jgi:hypothetical protein
LGHNMDTITTSRRLPAIVILILSAISAYAAEPITAAELSADLTVEVDGPLLAHLPLQFKLTITNTGKAPFFYWCGGPASYPNADPFAVAVTDARGQTCWLPLHNGQFVEGSGTHRPVETTQTLPAACDPLGPGTYTLRVAGKPRVSFPDGTMIETWPAMSARPITIKIEEDRPALAAAEKDLLARAEKESFARHVALVYSIDPVIKTWLAQLLDDNPKTAFEVVGRLQHVRRLPAGGDALLKQAALKHCHPKSGKPDHNLLYYISLIGRNVRTEEALDAVLMIARCEAAQYARTAAVDHLAYFPQKRAEDALVAFTMNKGTAAYWPAVVGLARRHNRIALAPLLQAATDQDLGRRASAVRALSGLRDYSVAREALNAALNDPHPGVRQSAQLALRGAVVGQDELPHCPGRPYPK